MMHNEMSSMCFEILMIFYCFAWLASNCVTAHGEYANVLSEQLNRYCEWQQRHPNSSGGENVKHVRRGKAGPRGYPGPVGPAGIVNYTTVEQMITGRLAGGEYDEKISILTERLEVLERELKKSPRKDCNAVKESEAKSWNGTGGLFDIYPGDSGRVMEVYCDAETNGGDWIVFQRRMDGSQNFERNFADYVTGFGRKDREFWLGLEKLHFFTNNEEYELRVDLVDWDNNKAYASYTDFSVGNASSQYTLTVGGYSGTAGDSMAIQNGQKFHTRDRDKLNCARNHKGAWWYNHCHHSNLNGLYIKGGNYGRGYAYGVEWYAWRNSYYHSMKFTEMKIRRKW